MGLFKKRSVAPALPSSGHPGDDQLLAQIAQHSDLNGERHWVHYLYTADEPSARAATSQIESAGWQLQKVDVAADGHGWVVIAEKHGAVTNPDSVREAREFFEGVAGTTGGDYDGWEASL